MQVINTPDTSRSNPTMISPFRSKLPPDYKPLANSLDNIIDFLEKIAERNHITSLWQKNTLPFNLTRDIQRYINSVEYIYNALPVIMCLLDKETRFLAVNQRFADIKGLPIDEYIGRPAIEVMPGLPPEVLQTMNIVFEGGHALLNVEVSAVTPIMPNINRYWAVNVLPVIDNTETTTAIVITAEEITERKQLELFLKAYADDLEKLVAERTVELEAINEKLAAIKRLDPDSGETVKQEALIPDITKNIYNDLSVTPTFETDEKISGISCIAHNITDKIISELKLRRSEERFHKAFNLSPTMMSIYKLDDGCIVDVNETWLRVLGFTREEVINKSCVDLGITDPGFFEDHRNDIANVRGQNSPEYDIRTKNGAVLTIFSSVDTIVLDGTDCLLICSIDVTREKKLQSELARLDRLNLVGEMAASIGHEIRNPMTAVRGFLQMLSIKDEYKDDMIYFELMINELDRANAILSEYLGMAKKKTVNLRPCRLDHIVKSIYPMLQSDAIRRDMNIKLHLHGQIDVFIDENEVRQLIINLARNGMEAMKAGGALTIRVFSRDEHVVLSVSDEGNGLPREIINNLGTPFLTTKPNGTGLGLAVCYSIASRHNATIDFDTGPQGTTFYVSFPLS